MSLNESSNKVSRKKEKFIHALDKKFTEIKELIDRYDIEDMSSVIAIGDSQCAKLNTIVNSERYMTVAMFYHIMRHQYNMSMDELKSRLDKMEYEMDVEIKKKN